MPQSAPPVTILMSVYNGMKYLPAAIRSILEQTFEDYEFLIINDGSTEPVLDIIEEYRDSRIRIHNQENIGLTRSLNKGIELASGQLIARMDSDDVSHPHRIHEQLRIFTAHKKIELVGSAFDIVDGNLNLIETKPLILHDDYRLWRLLFHNNYGHGTVMFKREAVIKIGKYNEKLKYAQDYDLWSRLSHRGNTKIIPETLYSYRHVESGSQASVKNYSEQLATAIMISNRNLMTCNPFLSEPECKYLRSLYWNFELNEFNVHGLKNLADTFVRFCVKFRISLSEKEELARLIIHDVIEIGDSMGLDPEMLNDSIKKLHETYK